MRGKGRGRVWCPKFRIEKNCFSIGFSIYDLSLSRFRIKFREFSSSCKYHYQRSALLLYLVCDDVSFFRVVLNGGGDGKARNSFDFFWEIFDVEPTCVCMQHDSEILLVCTNHLPIYLKESYDHRINLSKIRKVCFEIHKCVFARICIILSNFPEKFRVGVNSRHSLRNEFR